jgi:tetratricopeptide (TPR) repeat protein
MDALSDRRQEPYYATVGQIRMLQKNYDQGQAVYVEGAQTWPLWSDMQLMAGVQASDNKQYQVAEYFLLRAAEQMPRNPVPLYHLGVTRFEQGYAEEADVYFNEALSLGLDEERTGYVAGTGQQMEEKRNERLPCFFCVSRFRWPVSVRPLRRKLDSAIPAPVVYNSAHQQSCHGHPGHRTARQTATPCTERRSGNRSVRDDNERRNQCGCRRDSGSF